MPAHRCSTCNVNWPTASEYSKCPSCGESTWYGYNVTAVDAHEAKELADEAKERERRRKEHEDKYRAFDEFYADREAQRFLEELSQAW